MIGGTVSFKEEFTMITIKKEVNPNFAYDPKLLGPEENLVFFDIETTGLSFGRSSLYLIGVLFSEDKKWIFAQYFAESILDEEALIDSFFELINKKRRLPGNLILIHYNGDMFDIPFLKGCIKNYRLSYDFTDIISLDLYRKVKPLKSILGLSDCKLKSVEKFLGLYREDGYSGGELIYVYEDYLKKKQKGDEATELLDMLLLHNEEDILDMPRVLSVLSYNDMFSSELKLSSHETVDLSELGFNAGGSVLDLNYQLPARLPVPLDFSTGPFNIAMSDENLNITAEMREGELKYFFNNYKDYYYLIYEDYAVHKSVGEFVDKGAKKKATAKTCYMKKTGLFFPQPKEIFTPGFYEEYKGKDIYAIYDDNIFSDISRASNYAHAVLELILKASKVAKKADIS